MRIKFKKIDKFHIVCTSITIFLLALLLFSFRNSIFRLLESLIDLINSFLVYGANILNIDTNFTPTVNNLSQFAVKPAIFIPETWEAFCSSTEKYFNTLFNLENFKNYLALVSDILTKICYGILIGLPFYLILKKLINNNFKKINNNYNKDTKPLKIYKKIVKNVYIPVKNFIVKFYLFLKLHRLYYLIWLFFLCIAFNVYTIFIEFLAFYLYFIVEFDLSLIYIQIYKLILDLYVPLTTIPLIVWLIIGFIYFDKFRKNVGYLTNTNFEMRNRGFINERPIVLMICGTMGKKKTTALTDMGLSQEVMLRDKALELLIKNDLKFPNFPWINLERTLKRAMATHTIFNLATTRKFIRHLRKCFITAYSNPAYYKAIRRHLKKAYGIDHKNLLFDYDFELYGLKYDDNLKITNVWQTIETYSQLYFIYVILSSLILSNYSVRTDNEYIDMGNLPVWDTDFFRRNTASEGNSRYSHILDFDTLRLGRKLVEKYRDTNVFEFGVILITEIGKERGNNLENKDKKKKDDETNQKNDLFNTWLKMVRHSATVDNFPFVKVITDEQRPESWGADARDLCDIVTIQESSDNKLAMPFFLHMELIYTLIYGKFNDLYVRYRVNRGDNTLLMYLIKSVCTRISNYYDRIYNQYGYCVLKVLTESGNKNGKKFIKKYYLNFKKIYSDRFSTDCYSDYYYKKAILSVIGLDDIPTYSSIKASFDELQKQNSYFVNDIIGL